MAYVTAADIVDWLGNDRAVQLTAESGSTVDTDLIDKAIARVEPDVEMALRTRTHATITQADFPSTWSMIVGKVIDMVIFLLAARRPNPPENWKERDALARAWLEKLAKGEIDLPDVAANAPGADYDFRRPSAGAEDMV